jgi:hypothetical protein
VAFLSNKSPDPFGYHTAVAGGPDSAWQPEVDVSVEAVRALVVGIGPGGEGELDFSQLSIWYIHVWNGWDRFVDAQLWGDINWGFAAPSGGDLSTPVGTTADGHAIYEVILEPGLLELAGGQEYVIGISAVGSSSEVGSIAVLESSFDGPSDSQGSSEFAAPGWRRLSDDPSSQFSGVLALQVVAHEIGCEERECSAPGDADGDGDLDLVDFAEFQLCFSGPTMQASPECSCSDMDGNGTVDLVDFGEFQLGFTGGIM